MPRDAYQKLLNEKREKLSDWTLLELIRVGQYAPSGGDEV